jgi:hypothetical protein
MALADDLAVSAWLSFVCSVGAAPAPPIIFFIPHRAPELPGARGHRRSASKKWIKRSCDGTYKA